MPETMLLLFPPTDPMLNPLEASQLQFSYFLLLSDYLLASGASHACHSNVCAAGDGYTIVLVLHNRVGKDDVVAGREIKSITVVSCCLPVACRVGCISGRVVKSKAGDGQTITTGHVEAVSWPILNFKVRNDTVDHFVEDNEVIRPVEVLARTF